MPDTKHGSRVRRVPAYTSGIDGRGLGRINVIAGDNVSRVAINERGATQR